MLSDSENEIQTRPVIIFWPNDVFIHDKEEKFLVLGYRVNKNKIVVADIIPTEDFKHLHYSTTKTLLKHLTVIGCINSKSKKWNRTIEFNYETQQPLLEDHETLVYFKPPVSSHLEYYSLDPITINIFWTLEGGKEYNFYSSPDSKYSEKLRYHFLSPDEEPEMKEVLRLINLTNYTKSLVRQKDASQYDKMKHNVTHFCDDLLCFMFIIYNFSVVRFCSLLSQVLTYPIAKFPSVKSKSKPKMPQQYNTVLSLSLISHTFHQLNFRVKQFQYLPNQFQKLKISKKESEARIIKGTKFNPSEYIKFYNNLWLIVNDTLIGFIFSNFIRVNFNTIVSLVQWLVPLYERCLNQIILWLMNSPAGFKLNNELARFLGQLIFWVLEFWKNKALTPFVNNFPLILKSVQVISMYGGMTMATAMILDVFNLLFFNLYGLYTSCTRIYLWQLLILGTLFRLFYGKKYNVLKNRVDSNDYEFDQLMVGIILFTVLLYLLPTVFAFYLTFSCGRLIAMFFSTSMRFLLICLNHLPLVVLLLKLKNKERLPAGVMMDYQPDADSIGDFSLISKCLSFGEIYKSHMNSLMNFNLSNMNSVYMKITGTHTKPYTVDDVIENWGRMRPVGMVKNFLFGNVMDDYDYKKMF